MDYRLGLIVYILRSLRDPARHYVGTTDNLRRRLPEHNRGICDTTARHRPWELVAAIYVPDASVARRFERYLKSGSGRAFAKRHFGGESAAPARAPRGFRAYTAPWR